MTGQLQFATPTGTDVRRSDPWTSRDAARRAVGNSLLRDLVLVAHHAHRDGLTDSDLKRLLPEHNPGSVEKRRHDLVVYNGRRLDLLEATQTTRLTLDGCEAIVYRITDAGRRAVRTLRLATWIGARLDDFAHDGVAERMTAHRLRSTCTLCGAVETNVEGLNRHLRQAHKAQRAA